MYCNGAKQIGSKPMMAVLKHQPLPSITTHRSQTTVAPYQTPLTLTLLNNDLVAVSKQQQGTAQYLGPTGQHSRMFSIPSFHISGKIF